MRQPHGVLCLLMVVLTQSAASVARTLPSHELPESVTILTPGAGSSQFAASQSSAPYLGRRLAAPVCSPYCSAILASGTCSLPCSSFVLHGLCLLEGRPVQPTYLDLLPHRTHLHLTCRISDSRRQLRRPSKQLRHQHWHHVCPGQPRFEPRLVARE